MAVAIRPERLETGSRGELVEEGMDAVQAGVLPVSGVVSPASTIYRCTVCAYCQNTCQQLYLPAEKCMKHEGMCQLLAK